jgi:hypothetical protein
MRILDDGDKGNDGDAVAALDGLSVEIEARRGRTPTAAEVDSLTAEAHRIIALLDPRT